MTHPQPISHLSFYRHQTAIIRILTLLHRPCHSVIHRCEIVMVHNRQLYNIKRLCQRWHRMQHVRRSHDLSWIWIRNLVMHFIMWPNFLHRRHSRNSKNLILVEIWKPQVVCFEYTLFRCSCSFCCLFLCDYELFLNSECVFSFSSFACQFHKTMNESLVIENCLSMFGILCILDWMLTFLIHFIHFQH